VRNSIRLILSALIISGLTYAAAGAPAPSSAQISAQAAPIPPAIFAFLAN
jgi:hypothetical protein